jgi:hypothetical protein
MRIVTDEMFESLCRLLKYSFQEIDWNYDNLTRTEKLCVTRKQFEEIKAKFKQP